METSRPVQPYLASNAPVPIVLRPLNSYHLVEDCFRKILLALSAEFLPTFGRVDSQQADSMIRIRRTQQSDCVPILNANHSAWFVCLKHSQMGRIMRRSIRLRHAHTESADSRPCPRQCPLFALERCSARRCRAVRQSVRANPEATLRNTLRLDLHPGDLRPL